MKFPVIHLFVFFLLCTLWSKSQDTLLLRDGSTRLVKVIELSETTIKYKKSDHLKGPSYLILIDEVKAIHYGNGVKENFNKKPNAGAYSQYDANEPEKEGRWFKKPRTLKKPYKKSGPRIGFTYLGEGQSSDWINSLGKNPFITQIGWELESRIFTSDKGIAALLEYNLLLGGMEQGLFLPNGSILLAIRGPEGIEAAIGPNLFYYDVYTVLGMEFSIGNTFQFSDIYLPVHLSFVPSIKRDETVVYYNGSISQVNVGSGFRINLSIGFYFKKK